MLHIPFKAITILWIIVFFTACTVTPSDRTANSTQVHIIQSGPPSDLDTATSRLSESGLFLVTLQSNLEPIEINTIHSWDLTVTTPEGIPVQGAQIQILTLMPQHGHGMPTEPRVTDEVEPGVYRVEGMKFNMPGWWELTFDIDVGDGRDVVTFNQVLQ